MTTTRRPWGAGSIRQLGKDRWRIAVNSVDPLTGARKPTTKVVRGGKREAQAELSRLQNAANAERVRGADTTLATLFSEYLKAAQTEGDMSDFNAGQAQRQFDRYTTPKLAKTRIGDITPHTLGQLYEQLRTEGWARDLDDGAPRTLRASGGPLARKTVYRYHGNLSAAFAYAVELGWLDDNPAARRRRWHLDEAEVKPPNPKQLLAFLDHVDQLNPDPGAGTSPLPDFIPLLVATGARPAELCALRWSDYHPDTGRLTIDESRSRSADAVVKATKTRKIRHPTLGADARALLERRRSRYEPVAAGLGRDIDTWWVFPMASGPARPARPDTISRWFREARQAAGAPDVLTARNLRHFVASALVAEGVDVKTVAGRLGHSAEILLRRYAHLLDTTEAAAADIVARKLHEARD